MIIPLLENALEPIVRRQRWLWKLRGWSLGFAGLALLALAFRASSIPFPTTVLILGALVLIAVVSRMAENWRPDYRSIARAIEQRHPELHAALLTAVEQRPDPRTGKLHFLQQRVIADAVAHAEREQWIEAVPKFKLGAHVLLGALCCALFVVAAAHVARTARSSWHTGSSLVAQENPVEITPGDTAIERGAGFFVLAKFRDAVPGEATLVIERANASPERHALVKNLDDPVFGGGLPEVDASFRYRVEYSGEASRMFEVKVFEHPRLERADATVHYPEYTRLADKEVADTRRVSAVEGSKVDVAFQLNKPVKSAELVSRSGKKVPLVVDGEKPLAALRGFPLVASETYEVHLIDDEGRPNKVPAQLSLDALPNRRPELKFAAPRGDRRLSPIEEVTFRAETWDDFGLNRSGITVNIAGRGDRQIDFGKASAADERREVTHLVKLEDLAVKPDELVSWFLWAEDVGPDGKPRITASDMYFGEIRPFEEIYRRGDDQEAAEQQRQQQQQGGGRGGQAQKLAELQKQIISATWNLKRAEDSAPQSPTEKYKKDQPVIRDSQDEALKKATDLGEGVEDPKSRSLIDNVTEQMQTALDRLNAAEKSVTVLPDAVAAEQLAYNALLKLAAHEYRVTRQQRGAQSGSAQQGNQQQLDQLELKDEKQRYETKREAQPMQNEPQAEQLAILNRLKELAQRQQDINEKLKELQTALQEAKTEPEKEELARQLKRLREEEQQLLADLDEARQKMDQSAQQSQFADERRKLDQTRSEAQKAAEAMEQRAASQALASGTRAARNLQEMRDDFRKKTTGRFNEEMRQMRSDARQLAENQGAIGEKLKGEPTTPQRRTLDTSAQNDVAEKLEKQQADLKQLTEAMKRVSEQAEAAEPLLSKELYDTLRKTTQDGTDRTLEMTQRLAQRGYSTEAQKFEEKARQEIDTLKTGVERAAESVLGNEADALRRAQAELDTLANELNREIARARPDLAATAPGQATENQPRDGAGRNRDDAQQNQDPNADPNRREGNQAGTERDGRLAQNNDSGNAQRGNREGDQQQEQNRDAAENNGAGRRSQSGQPQNSGSGENAASPRDQQGESRSGEAQSGRQGDGRGEQPGEPRDANGRGQTAQNGQSQENQQGAPGSGQGEQGNAQRNGNRGQGGQQSQRGGAQQQSAQTDGQGGGGNAENGNRANPSDGRARDGRRRSLTDLASDTRTGGADRRGGTSGGGGGGNELERFGPLTGEDFAQWSDRLRNVEEMIDDPALRTEAARVRELAKGVRVEFKRHGVMPNWDLVNTKIRTPLAELRDRVSEELARREPKDRLVPIDRDPVPAQFAERVRRYYEDLGRSR